MDSKLANMPSLFATKNGDNIVTVLVSGEGGDFYS
jgi:hypothetical protein